MPNANKRLFLYEALELRAEYDARIKTLKDCLPETKENRNRWDVLRDDKEGVYRASTEFPLEDVRDEVARVVLKRRKLNRVIQQANFQHNVHFRGEPITLHEALDLRKGFNEQIGELHTQVVDAACERVIYKEGRDIVEPSSFSYQKCVQKLEEARLMFRELNRRLRAASFEAAVDYLDE